MANVLNNVVKVEYVMYEDCNEDDDESSCLACPECGSAGDYCPSVHHWCCDECGHLLEENPNNEQWECWNLECKAYPE